MSNNKKDENIVVEKRTYVLAKNSYFNGLYYQKGETIETSDSPTIHMGEKTEAEKSGLLNDRRDFVPDPSLIYDIKHREEELDKHKKQMLL